LLLTYVPGVASSISEQEGGVEPAPFETEAANALEDRPPPRFLLPDEIEVSLDGLISPYFDRTPAGGEENDHLN
jgi:hypothetical protein